MGAKLLLSTEAYELFGEGEGNTWFLLLVGLIGMGNNIYISSRDCTPIEHGIPIEKLELEDHLFPLGWRSPPTKKKPGAMEVLFNIEEKFPGTSQSLLKLFFPGRLAKEEEAKWASYPYSPDTVKDRLKEGRKKWYTPEQLPKDPKDGKVKPPNAFHGRSRTREMMPSSSYSKQHPTKNETWTAHFINDFPHGHDIVETESTGYSLYIHEFRELNS